MSDKPPDVPEETRTTQAEPLVLASYRLASGGAATLQVQGGYLECIIDFHMSTPGTTRLPMPTGQISFYPKGRDIIIHSSSGNVLARFSCGSTLLQLPEALAA